MFYKFYSASVMNYNCYALRNILMHLRPETPKLMKCNEILTRTL